MWGKKWPTTFKQLHPIPWAPTSDFWKEPGAGLRLWGAEFNMVNHVGSQNGPNGVNGLIPPGEHLNLWEGAWTGGQDDGKLTI